MRSVEFVVFTGTAVAPKKFLFLFSGSGHGAVGQWMQNWRSCETSQNHRFIRFFTLNRFQRQNIGRGRDGHVNQIPNFFVSQTVDDYEAWFKGSEYPLANEWSVDKICSLYIVGRGPIMKQTPHWKWLGIRIGNRLRKTIRENETMRGRSCLKNLKSSQPLVLPSLLLCDFGNLERLSLIHISEPTRPY